MVSQVESLALQSDRRSPHIVEGLVQIFTSEQRNFFTSVMAQALAIAGHGTSVLVVQFLKGGINQGHDHPMRLGQNLEWIRADVPRCVEGPQLAEEELASLRDLWQHTRSVVAAGRYELVVLDELSLAINFGLISEAEVLELVRDRPIHVDMILTGPDMPTSLLEAADQITELRRSRQP